ncbi:hypothetical protein KVR01_012495 [Diaporthe batatas]|uniref:uncharacterized protein n=1 Tax=Diaporthe batatas TaxID=748121 RepID=UPI001D056A38|nr:uncharacterized protein KVR01_012495 [Diaporthe batatas]KAG8157833.1 hypothetical protein KVR01_012495 [Diaporthe batatas]
MARSRSFRAVEGSQVAKATSGQARGGFSGAVDDVLDSVLEPAGRGTNTGRDKVPGQVRSVGERV